MPHFVSLLPTATAAMPAATPALSPTPAPGTLLPPDLTSPNFLAQFKSALKTLAKVVVPPPLTPHPPTDPNAAPLMSSVTDEEPAAPAAVDANKDADKHAASLMPDLLAELGFAVVPPAFPLPTPPKAVAIGAAGAATPPLLQQVVAQAQLPQSAAQLPLPQSATPVGMQPQAILGAPLQASPVQVRPPLQPLADPQPAPAPADAHLTQALADLQPAPAPADAHLTQALADLQLAQPLPAASLAEAVALLQPQTTPASLPLSPQPLEHLKPSDQPQSPASAVMAQPSLASAPDISATVMLQPAPGPHQPTAAAPAATSASAGLPIAVAQQASPGGSQSGGASTDHGRPTPDKSAPISSDGTLVQVAPVSDAAMVAAAAATMPASTAALPVQVSPSQVASQIANHADLIRLPGNQGLQIQLHPDDLGGVQVTVRYSPTGGVELHINAEHAATGALVQAGWGELRDALATQGISPDRLVLSVTGPSGAGQADLSGGGGGNRSDPNSASFSQNQSQTSQSSLGSQAGQDGQGQSRQDNAQQRSPGWNRPVEPTTSPDSSPRVASATAASSRIDYRV